MTDLSRLVGSKRALLPAAALVATLGLLGCGDSDTQKLLCPAKGIGVEAATGESCATAIAKDDKSAAAQDCLAQFSDYKKYDCREPQISIDKTKRPLLITADPDSATVEVSWTITNATTGNRSLNITGLGIAGDSSCFFSAQPEIESKEVKPGEMISMRITFKPSTAGEHHAAIYLISDAQNYPKMIMPVCALLTNAPPPATGDAGVKPDSAPGVTFDCQDVTKTCNEACHPGCTALIQ